MGKIKKVIINILIGSLIMGMMSGCGGREINPSKDLSTSGKNEPVNSASMEEQGTNSPTKEKTPVTLLDGRAFSEGIAWVRYKDENGNLQLGWLHPDGLINQPFPTDEINAYDNSYSDFSGGYSYNNCSGGAAGALNYFIIMNSFGEVVVRSPDDGCSYQILCGGDGFYLVEQSIRNMTQNEDRYGLISADGTWIFACSLWESGKTHPLSADVIPDQSNMNYNFQYLGSGVFQVIQSGSNVLYNARAQKGVLLGNKIAEGGYSDGWVLVREDNGEETINLYVISEDFEELSIPVTIPRGAEYRYQEGILFVANPVHSGNRSTYLTDGKFYHTDGTILADFSQNELEYEDAKDLYRFSDGNAAVVVFGADGYNYLGIIDLTGNFTFDPIKISRTLNYDDLSIFSGGAIVCTLSDREEAIVKASGEIIRSETLDIKYSDYYFSEGYTIAYTEYGTYYLSTEGSILELYVMK